VVDAHGVDEEMIWRGGEAGDGVEHGKAGGLVDVDVVDGGGVDFCDGDGESEGLNFREEALSLGCGELLGVAEALECGFSREDDGSGDDGTEEGSATDFIDPGDESGSLGAGRTFVAVRADEGAEHALLACGGGF
jgi:hypothetical protein